MLENEEDPVHSPDHLTLTTALLEEALSLQIREKAFKEILQGATEALIRMNESKATQIEKLETGIEELVEEATELKTLAVTDPLTELDNRRGLEDHVRRLVSRVPPPQAERHRQEGALHHITVLALDIDDFKLVNDEHGHEAGDEVLREVARNLIGPAITGHRLREDDVVARVGGEEFILVFPGTPISEVQSWLTTGEEMRIQPLEVKVGQETVLITMSGGLTEYHYGEDFARDTLNRADRGLYKSKHSGKNKVVLVPRSKKRA